MEASHVNCDKSPDHPDSTSDTVEYRGVSGHEFGTLNSSWSTETLVLPDTTSQVAHCIEDAQGNCVMGSTWSMDTVAFPDSTSDMVTSHRSRRSWSTEDLPLPDSTTDFLNNEFGALRKWNWNGRSMELEDHSLSFPGMTSSDSSILTRSLSTEAIASSNMNNGVVCSWLQWRSMDNIPTYDVNV